MQLVSLLSYFGGCSSVTVQIFSSWNAGLKPNKLLLSKNSLCYCRTSCASWGQKHVFSSSCSQDHNKGFKEIIGIPFNGARYTCHAHTTLQAHFLFHAQEPGYNPKSCAQAHFLFHAQEPGYNPKSCAQAHFLFRAQEPEYELNLE